MYPCTRSTLALALALAPLLPACQDRTAEADSAPAAVPVTTDPGAPTTQVVDITGMDYAYDAPLEISSGWTTFRFTNRGPEPHHLTLMRLEGGHTVADFVDAVRQRKPLTGIATALGGANAPMPGEQSNATMHLEAGQYALACLIPSPDGVPHIIKGMVTPITVRAGGAEAAPEPAADVELAFTDYAFELSREITPGRHTIRVTTDPAATEAHEVVLARLTPGRTADDLNRWMHRMDGPPPAQFIGGITPLDPGRTASFTADFTPGDYALVCPLPSVHDGQPHSNKGMIQQFAVR